MLDMITRFLRMVKSVRLALIEAGSNLSFSDSEITLLEQLKEVLQPAKFAVVRLSRRDATLLTAERINNVVFSSLERASEEDPEKNKKKNPLAEPFLHFLKTEIEKRRPTNLVHLMEYLNDSSFIKSSKVDSFGHVPRKTALTDLTSSLLSRLFSIEEEHDDQVWNAPKIK